MAASITSLRLSTGSFQVTRAIARPQVYSKSFFPASFKAVTPLTSSSSIRSITMDKDQSRGESTEGISEWKKRAPYKVHDSNDNFKARYEASCHCGKVKYQLSREEPLDSKLCHCTTCQTQHGTFAHSNQFQAISADPTYSCSFPVGCHLPQGRHQLLARPPQSRVVRPYRQVGRAQASLQGPLQLLPQSNHGRGQEHDLALP